MNEETQRLVDKAVDRAIEKRDVELQPIFERVARLNDSKLSTLALDMASQGKSALEIKEAVFDALPKTIKKSLEERELTLDEIDDETFARGLLSPALIAPEPLSEDAGQSAERVRSGSGGEKPGPKVDEIDDETFARSLIDVPLVVDDPED